MDCPRRGIGLDLGAGGAVRTPLLRLGVLALPSGLRHVTAALAGVFLTLIPVFGVAGAMVVGERLEPRQWVGAIIVVASVGLLMRSLASETNVDAQRGRSSARN